MGKKGRIKQEKNQGYGRFGFPSFFLTFFLTLLADPGNHHYAHPLK